MTDDNEQIIKVDESIYGIGKRLREAREAKKLEITSVANQLNLSADTIKKIEVDDWSGLHGRAYVRGYILSYAKLLGLSADDLLISFNVEYGDEELTHRKPVEHGKMKQSRRVPWLLVLLIALVLSSGFGYQQWQQYQQEKIAIDADGNSSENNESVNSSTGGIN